MEMQQINQILNDALKLTSEAKDLHILDKIRTDYLGKKGHFTELLKTLGTLSPEERPKQGAVINSAKEKLIAALQQRYDFLKTEELDKNLSKEIIDVTLPGCGQSIGSLHPVDKVRRSLEDFFIAMGFNIYEGPEIEDDYYNFTALNIPLHHPARAEHDTFYFPDGKLLRTHTSPAQIRAMQKYGAPLRVITPGRVYRCDSDSTHSPMFNQLEGFVIDKGINFANLKWLLNSMLECFFKKAVNIRFRPSYFQFTEPSAEVDIEWKVNNEVRWLEVLGCGMIHPNVLKAGNIDSEEFSGFAFGLGLDRMAMLRYEVNDLRIFFENDLEFLDQF